MAARRSNRPRDPRALFLVSACLAGINCTYKGGNKSDPVVKKLTDAGMAIPVCPEVMGGLTTPRENAEIAGGDGSSVLEGRARVISSSGKDLSAKYISGSITILDIAKRRGIHRAILKSKSPACGSGDIYDGTFRKALKRGNGVLTSLLITNGIKILTEKEVHKVRPQK